MERENEDTHEHEHNHDHGSHNHHHHDISSMKKGRLIFVIAFNFIITLAEIVGGLFSGSLSLISDAFHNLSDTASIILSYVSIKISEKPKDKLKTYGYKRANILTAFINSASLTGIAVFLVVEAIKRFTAPSPVAGNIVIIVAVVGLLGNFFSAVLLKKGAKENINIKSSYLHLVSDALASVAVIVSGVLIHYTRIYWIDPVFTILINIVILKSCYSVLKESINILMQSTPEDMKIDEINTELQGIDEVRGTHHVHVWRLDENNVFYEGHVLVNDMLISESSGVCDKIQHILAEHFGINHAVIQFESADCNNGACKI